MEFVFSMLSLIIALAALFFSIWQFFAERRRNRSEATIHAFDELEAAVFSDPAYKKLPTGDEALRFALSDQNEWNAATLALSRMEHFAVGVNCGIYDIHTLNRMAGGFLIDEYARWDPVIVTKRRRDPHQKHYDEFERLCQRLRLLRQKSYKKSWGPS